MELKEKLAELRGQKGLTQDELARALGVTRQAVSKWERGIISPATVNLAALGRLYGVSLDELVNGEQPPQEAAAAAVAVAEPENTPAPQRHSPLRLAGTAVLAGCIFLTGVASGIVIGSTVLRKPEKPKDSLTIIWQDDILQENIDLDELTPFDGEIQDIEQ